MDSYKLSSIQLIYRLAFAFAATLPLLFTAISLLTDGYAPAAAFLTSGFSIIAALLYWRAGVYVRVSETHLTARLSPFKSVTLERADLISLEQKEISPLGREFGSRGRRGPGETLFIDAGQHTSCIEIRTRDDFTLQLGIGDESELAWLSQVPSPQTQGAAL